MIEHNLEENEILRYGIILKCDSYTGQNNAVLLSSFLSITRRYNHDMLILVRDPKTLKIIDFAIIFEKYHTVDVSKTSTGQRQKVVFSLKNLFESKMDIYEMNNLDDEIKSYLFNELYNRFKNDLSSMKEIKNYDTIIKLTDDDIAKLNDLFPSDFDYIIDSDIKYFLNAKEISNVEIQKSDFDEFKKIFDETA